MLLNRRKLLTCSLASPTICAFGRGTGAATATQESSNDRLGPIIDTLVFLGHWPFERRESESPRELAATLRRSGITRAWTGSIDGLFHKDIAAVNSRLVADCSQDDLFIPFGTVNPTLPDWEDDIRRCHEIHRMPGIRLYPTHHGYKLDDSRIPQLLSLAAAKGLIVQLVIWFDRPKYHWLTPPVNFLELKPYAPTTGDAREQQFANLRLIISGVNLTEADNWSATYPGVEVYFDTARPIPEDRAAYLAALNGSQRILFASATPLRQAASSTSILADAAISKERRHAIAYELAEKAIGKR